MKKIVSRAEAKKGGLTRYFTGEPCKYGHIDDRLVSNCTCVQCMRDRNKEEPAKSYMKKYRKENKERIRKKNKEYMKEYYQENKGYIKDYVKEYTKENSEYIKQRQKEYVESNRAKINIYKKDYSRKKYTEDSDFKMAQICRAMLKRTLKATNSTKENPTYDILGYCNVDLANEIEMKFIENMTWDNYGDWVIDHVHPVTRYIKDGIEDPAVINHLDNLIPMWSSHNLEKSDRTLEEYLEDRNDLSELYGRFLGSYYADRDT